MIPVTQDTCDYCHTAEQQPDWPLYRAQCRGCGIRALASGPLFHKSGLDGSLAQGYRKALCGLFGDDWRNGHQQVKAVHERIRAARALL